MAKHCLIDDFDCFKLANALKTQIRPLILMPFETNYNS